MDAMGRIMCLLLLLLLDAAAADDPDWSPSRSAAQLPQNSFKIPRNSLGSSQENRSRTSENNTEVVRDFESVNSTDQQQKFDNIHNDTNNDGLVSTFRNVPLPLNEDTLQNVSDFSNLSADARKEVDNKSPDDIKLVDEKGNRQLAYNFTSVFTAPLPVFQVIAPNPPVNPFSSSKPGFQTSGASYNFVPTNNLTPDVVASLTNLANLAGNNYDNDNGSAPSYIPTRPSSSLGQVSSPFFFLCNYPRHGEVDSSRHGGGPSSTHQRLDDPQEDVTITLTVLGPNNLDRGYKSNTGYEIGVVSSVGVDGFIVTGVLALTPEHAQSLAAPTPPKGSSTEGRVCTVLYSTSSRKQHREQTFLWSAPAHGSGCIAFIATGSIGDTIVYRDVNIFEVCEEASGPARLQAPAVLSSGYRSQEDLLFRDNFDTRMDINKHIWASVMGGHVRRGDETVPSSALQINGNLDSFAETRTLDLTHARDLHFTLSAGPCTEEATVELLFGSVEPFNDHHLLTGTNVGPSNNNNDEEEEDMSTAGSGLGQEHNSGYDSENTIGSGSSFGNDIDSVVGRTEAVSSTNAREGSGGFMPLESTSDSAGRSEDPSVPGSAQAAAERCLYWQQAKVYKVSSTTEHHTVQLPPQHRHKDACIKFMTTNNFNTNLHLSHNNLLLAYNNNISSSNDHLNITEDYDGIDNRDRSPNVDENDVGGIGRAPANKCWVLDDVAVGLFEEGRNRRKNLNEDFDSIDSSNWLQFLGGKVEKSCGSETNVLVFHNEGGGPREATTALLDLYTTPPDEDVILAHHFTSSAPHGWTTVGGSVKHCPESSTSDNALLLDGEGVRKICTPIIDTRNVDVIQVLVSAGCSPARQYSVGLSVYSEKYLQRDALRTVEVALGPPASAADEVLQQMLSVVLPPSSQSTDTRLCVEQRELGVLGSSHWRVHSMVLLPHQPSTPRQYFQARVNLGCTVLPEHFYRRRPYETPLEVALESTTDFGVTWAPLHDPCLPGACEGPHQGLQSIILPGYSDGWSTVTVPLPYHSLTPHTRLRLVQHTPQSTTARRSNAVWGVDNLLVGECVGGCSGRGLCHLAGPCRCEFGYSGGACEISEQENPRYLAEPFTLPVDATANLQEVWGGLEGFQCGVVGGAGEAGVFMGWGRRSLTTVAINTTDATLLQLHYFGGTTSQVGKCPGADHPSEAVYLHYSCDEGLSWHLLQTMMPGEHSQARHISIDLPASARSDSCRFRLWQPQHSGAGRDMWAIDDLTVTSHALNNIQLEFQDLDDANSSLRFHLGSVGSSCERDSVLVFPRTDIARSTAPAGEAANNRKKRLLETKSLAVGPSFMMQFSLVIGCRDERVQHPLEEDLHDLDNVVMLEYSLNHGLSWKLVQRPCSPSTPGCQSHFSRGTVYHSTEFNRWKRVTLRLPRHTWSSNTRLRLREGNLDEYGQPQEEGRPKRNIEWAVDNLYIGHQCNGLCSGHGRCTLDGCICDDNFHGQKCIPVHKLHRAIRADFDENPRVQHHRRRSSDDSDDLVEVNPNFVPLEDLELYDISLVGGQLVENFDGCGVIVSGKNVYFGAPGVRQLEVDDMAASGLGTLQFHITIGGAAISSGFRIRSRSQQTRTCHRGDRRAGISGLSEGSVVLQYSTDGGLEWLMLRELLPDQYRAPKLFREILPSELVNAASGVVRFRIWQPMHGIGDQWSIDNLYVLPDTQRDILQSDASANALSESPWLTITTHHRSHYCPQKEKYQHPQQETPHSDTNNFSNASLPHSNLNNSISDTGDGLSNPDAQYIGNEAKGSINAEPEEVIALVLNGPELMREAATKPLKLSEGDVIYFMVKLGCDTSEGSQPASPQRTSVGGASDSAPLLPSEGPRPVVLEYSTDGGLTWTLVVPPCPPSAYHCRPAAMPSVYRPDLYKEWEQVMVDVDHRLSMSPIELRWRQDNPSGGYTGEFALKGVYAGPPCPRHCSGHGFCTGGLACRCHDGYTGKYCDRAPNPRLPYMQDDPAAYTDGDHSPYKSPGGGSRLAALRPGVGHHMQGDSPWLKLEGASVVEDACGPKNIDGPMMLFAGDSPRVAVLKEVDTRRIKSLSFNLQIGNGGAKSSLCLEGEAPRDNVLVQYSTDAGLHWNTLLELEPKGTVNRTRPFSVDLPPNARSRQTMFRWWQPDPSTMATDDITLVDDDQSRGSYPGQLEDLEPENMGLKPNDRAEWQLGDVKLMANDTLPHSLSSAGPIDDESVAHTTETWFLLRGGSLQPSTCHGNETMLLFDSNKLTQLAETWDVEATEATMIQFDLFGACPERPDSDHQAPHQQRPPPHLTAESPYLVDPSSVPSIAVEFSTDGGNTWALVRELCAPPDTSCPSYDLGSVFNLPLEEERSLDVEETRRDKRRVMIEMPRNVAGKRLRVRFRQVLEPLSTSSWGLSHVFLGDSCPWMCSGHGYCTSHGECSCDHEYYGDICVPASVLPCELLDTFNVPETSDHKTLAQEHDDPSIVSTPAETVQEGGTGGGRTSAMGNVTLSNNTGVDSDRWWRTRGAKTSLECGVLVAGSALVFAGEGIREAVTIDLDMTSGQFIQFNIMLGCGDGTRDNNNNIRKKHWRPEPGWQRDTSVLTDSFAESFWSEDSKPMLSTRDEGVLVQYSISGGINWELLKEIHYSYYQQPRFVSINLADFPSSQSNSTRFRFWQPDHSGVYGEMSWALDNVYIGGSPIVPNVLYEDFNGGLPMSDAWVDWPNGHVGQLCQKFESRKSLVFPGGRYRDGVSPARGERALYSKDVSVYGDSVLQFDIKIGCSGSGGATETASYRNVSVEFSTDYGNTWQSVRELAKPSHENYNKMNNYGHDHRNRNYQAIYTPQNQMSNPISSSNANEYRSGRNNNADEYFNGDIVSSVGRDYGSNGRNQRTSSPITSLQRVSPDCLHELKAPSVYYWNSAPDWRRELIPLFKLQICGNVRFRWVENGGEISDLHPGLSWGLDNIYIGPACIYNCNGHGHCINGDTCVCDDGYDPETACLPARPNPATVKITFEEDLPSPLFSRVSGGEISSECPVMTGRSFVFTQRGERMMVTTDLDMSSGSVVQFYLRLGCEPVEPIPSPALHHHHQTEVLPILLQFSTDGGISWVLVAELTKDMTRVDGRPYASHFTVPLPDAARTNSSRLRWWQPSLDGAFGGSWAIDEIYIGSSTEAHTTFSPPSVGSWLLTPGASISPACGEPLPVLYFNGGSGTRFAETPDLIATDSSYLQFVLVMGCSTGDPNCYGMTVEYSTSHGQHWSRLPAPSPPFPQHNPVQDNPPRWVPNLYMADLHQERTLITLPLPPQARARSLRIRFIQHGAPRDGPKDTWALPHVYFGAACNGGCSSRGLCVNDQCLCDAGWTGSSCSASVSPLPRFLSEEFSGGVTVGNWRSVVGASLSAHCPAGGVGDVLHFTGSCSRYLESRDLDLRDAHYVQFNIVAGCSQGDDIVPSSGQPHPNNNIRLSSGGMYPETYQGNNYRQIHQETNYPRTSQSNNHRQTYQENNNYPQQYGETYPQTHSQNGYRQTYQEPDLETYTSDVYKDLYSKLFNTDSLVGNSYRQSFAPPPYVQGYSRNKRNVGSLNVVSQTRSGGPLRNEDGRYISTRDILGTAEDKSKIVVQLSCDAGMSWSTLNILTPDRLRKPTYVWLEIPSNLHCHGGRVRWWQTEPRSDGPVSWKKQLPPQGRLDWAIDSIVIDGSIGGPPQSLEAEDLPDYKPPQWINMYNIGAGRYCGSEEESPVAKSTLTEPAVAHTSDIRVTGNTSLHFELAIGCDALWDKPLPPVSVEYSLDFGYTWSLVRSTCLPGDASCLQLDDSSVFYGPLSWSRLVYHLDHLGPAKFVRFRWYQPPTQELGDLHQWSLRNVYIGQACPSNCLGRGYCMGGTCYCDDQYTGTYCQYLLADNVPYIRDTFKGPSFLPHWSHVQGGLHSQGCDGLIEEPPAITLQGSNTRSLKSVAVDTRSGKFVLFTALIGGKGGRDHRGISDGAEQLCRPAESRMHNVFLQYSVDGGIHWQLLRELDYHQYVTPTDDYVLLPPGARSPATLFRFWQPRQTPTAPAWSLDNVFIGGSEISASQLTDSFDGEPQVSQWLFAPHSSSHHSYCSSNSSALVWEQDKPGTREITSQEIIVTQGHVLQFKISIGCEATVQCPSQTPNVRLEFSKDGGSSPWKLLHQPCLPSGSGDSDCLPYVYHPASVFETDIYKTWTRVTIPLPEKTWSSTTQLRWHQSPTGGERPLAWSLSGVYVGASCPHHCYGRGDCLQGRCHCDHGYYGESCEPRPSSNSPTLPESLIDGFEGDLSTSWSSVLGGWASRSCNSMAPFGNGKHLYFGGCGTRSAVTKVLDTRRAGKVIFVLRIGSLEGIPGCSIDTQGPVNVLDKGVVLQYSLDMGVLWKTINTHDPAEYRRARRVVYSLPMEARSYGVQLRWWQPLHGDFADQWAIDNVEIDLSDPKDTSQFEVLHEGDEL